MIRRETDVALLAALFHGLGEWIAEKKLAQDAGLKVDQLEVALRPYLEAGYPVEFHPQGRVRLNEPPDVWCGEEISARCSHLAPRWVPLILAETTSTNDVARERAGRDAAEGFVVAASRQTKGRGRLGRSWDSRAGSGLYVSILLRPALPIEQAGQLTILASVAMADAVEAITAVRPMIKWPNDLFVGGRKLGGLLIETEVKSGRLAYAVLGMGINVNHDAADFAPPLRETATSLRLVSGRSFRRADLLVELLTALSKRLARPFDEARESWKASSLTLGQRVTLTTLTGTRSGQAIGLDPAGALLLRTESGAVETVTSGDMSAA